jgi:hypothetical protein
MVLLAMQSQAHPFRPKHEKSQERSFVMAPINEDIKQRADAVFGENRQEPVTERAKQETRQRVVPFLSDRKERLVEQLNQTAGALRESEKQIDNSRGGDLIRISAQKIEQLGGYLGTRDINEIIDDVRKYARARPWTVMGGAFLLGLASARFMKAGGRSTPGS